MHAEEKIRKSNISVGKRELKKFFDTFILKLSFLYVKKLSSWISRHRLIVFYYLIFFWCGFLFFLTGLLNPFLTKLFSEEYTAFVNNIHIGQDEIMGIFTAPILEEIVKFIGYGIIFFIPSYFWRWYNSKEEFINDHIMFAFLISIGLFGFMEGISHNSPKYGFIFFWMYVLLNICIHMTYSIYPFILGRCYSNWFIVFLPIAMLFHVIHNFILNFLWDNKWVTFTMFSIFFIPLMIVKRKDIYQKIIYLSREHIPKIVVCLFFISLYLLMFFSVMFYGKVRI